MKDFERELPKDRDKPFTINGIRYANREAYQKRLEEDAEKMAHFLYDMYLKRKRDQNVAQ